MILDETLRTFRGRLDALVGDIDPASPRGRKRLRLLTAAIDRFVAHGYRKTSIDEIAGDAGVAKGTFYLHFESKAAVLLAAAAFEKSRLFALVDGIFAAEVSARERLRRFVRAAVLMVAGSPLLSRIVDGDLELLAAMIELDPALTAQATADHSAFLGELLEQAAGAAGISEQDRRERIAVMDALSLLAPRLRIDHVRQGMSIERFAEVLAAVVVDGVVPVADEEAAR